MNEEQLRKILQNEEDYGLEFKAAGTSFGRGQVHDYCAAMANENGGFLLLGVDDNRNIIGTSAFSQDWNKLAHELTEHLHMRIKVFNVPTSDGRVVAFEVPRHEPGKPVQVSGGTGKYRYPIRNGESLDEMDVATLQHTFAEREDDWSSDVIAGATFQDLDVEALASFRQRWAEHTKRSEYLKTSTRTMLKNLQLLRDEQVTAAALLLFGQESAMTKFLPDAEIIFEWRNNEQDIAYGERKSWRAGFMLVQESIWKAINARNTVFRYRRVLFNATLRRLTKNRSGKRSSMLLFTGITVFPAAPLP